MNKSKQSYSLINLASINIGTMIGVGIFFKNKGILEKTNNIYIALFAWALGSFLVYALALAFSEASSATARTGESGTLSNWMRIFVGKKAGRLVHQLMSFQYYPIFSVLLCYYAVTFTYKAIGVDNAFWLITMGLTLASFALLALGNALSYGFGKIFQLLGTFIKFIPLLSVVILGFLVPTVPASASTFAGIVGDGNATWKWASLVAALPSVFFALDAFYGGLALSKEERSKGDAIKATMISVVLVSFFYMAFAAAVGFGTTDGDLFPLFEKTFSAKGAKFLYIVIAISAMTVANGMMVAGTRQIKNTADDKEFLPINSIKSVTSDGRFASQTALLFVIGTLYALVLFFGAKLMGESESKLMDTFGDAIVLFAFSVYSIIALGVFANRFSNKVKVVKIKGIWMSVLASTIVLTLIGINFIQSVLSNSIISYLIVFIIAITLVLAKITDLSEGKIDK